MGESGGDMVEVMTRQDRIEVLQDWVSKNSITHLKNLEDTCKMYGLDEWEDILHPMGWNCCERCGALWDSEQLYWLDYMEDGGISEDLERGLEQDNQDYCCLCEDCVKELVEKGKEIK